MHADVFDRVRVGRWTARVRTSLSKSDIRNLLPGDDSSAECPDEFTPVASSDYARVFRGRVFFDGANRTVYLKRYLCRSKLDSIKHLFRASRARRAFNASLMLRRNGFGTPAVVGLFERRIGPFRTGNSLLTEEVTTASSMVELLTDMSDDRTQETISEKRSLIAAFARTVGQMHARGIFHGDLRLGNVLVVKEDSRWRFFLIDNERTKKFVGLPASLRVKNLVQVNMFRRGISNSDRLRFFSTYLSMNPSLQVHYARWAEKIVAKTKERLSRKDWPDD
jgi:tRNA A-37 threonylcarbamoyl transferase component Bud32